MEAGTVVVRGTVWGWIVFGFSYKHCWFQPDDGTNSEMVIPNHASRRAMCCRSCQTVVITGPTMPNNPRWWNVP